MKTFFYAIGVAILATLLLAGCAGHDKVAPVVYIVPTQDPEITVPQLILLPVNLDAPRDQDGKVTLNSNLYRGFDRASYDNFRVNTARVDQYIRTLLILIEQRNALTRKHSEDAKAKLKEIGNDAAIKATSPP